MAYISVTPNYENYFDADGGEVTIYAVLYGFDMSTLEYGWDRNYFDDDYDINNKEFRIWGLTTYNDNPALEIKLYVSSTSNFWRDVVSSELYVKDGSGNEEHTKIAIIQNGIKTDPVIESTPSSLTFKYNGGFQDVQVSYINFETIDEPYWGDWGNPDKFGFTTLSSNTTTSGNDTITTVTYRIYANETVDKKYASLIFIGTDMLGRETNRSLSINQKRKANPSSIEPSVNNFHFSTSATTGSFKVIYKDTSSTSNINTPTTTVSWFRITSTSTQYSDFDIIRTYRYSVTKNTSALDRTGTITFRSIGDDDIERSFTMDLLQDGVADYDGGIHDNYVGYFKSLDGASYTVKLITDNTSTDWGILNMQGETPFVVSYNVSNTPFEPLRTSTATITVVHDKYLDELYSPYAKGTSVELYKNTDECVWCGYLVPKTYNQGYANHYETIELEAADCVSVLQYIDYELINEGSCVTFKDIIDKVLDNTHITTYYWPHSKQANGSFLTPDAIGIFERNFFENDTDDPWNLQDVMFEMCQYLGVTSLQWGDALYFVDYTALSQGDDRYYKYMKNPTRTVQGADEYISNLITMTSELSRGNDADISFEPIFNKVSVKDNFYNVEELIPNIFDDKYLTNRNGDFFSAQKIDIPSPKNAKWVKNVRKIRDDVWASEETADDKYTYFMRLYDHQYFESYYEEIPYSDFTPGTMSAPEDLIGRLGATIVDMAAVDNGTFYGEVFDPTNSGNGVQVGTVDYANTVDYKRYLCICENHEDGTVWDDNSNALRLVMRTPSMKLPCQITEESYLVINYAVTKSRYKDRPYLNPDWCHTGASGPDAYREGTGHWAMTQWPQGPSFRLIVGDKAWYGSKGTWVDKNKDVWDTRFGGSLLKNSPAKDFWNEELKIANTVKYSMNINESGYAIPLSGISQDDEFYIEILCPQVSFYANKKLDLFEDTEFESHNAWCWVSDFSIKLCEKGQDVEKLDNDVVYENVIDDDSVNDFGELTFKFTTWHPNIKPSYSNVVTWVDGKRVMLEKITEANLMNNPQTAEENMIERHVLQYSTPTKKISHSLPIDGITPFDRITALDISSKNASFMQLGTEIDFAMGMQKITYIQCK